MYDSDVEGLVLEVMKELGIKLTIRSCCEPQNKGREWTIQFVEDVDELRVGGPPHGTSLKDQIRSALIDRLGKLAFYKDHLVVIGRQGGKYWYRILSADLTGLDEPAETAVPAKYFSDSKEQAFEEAKKRIDKKLF